MSGEQGNRARLIGMAIGVVLVLFALLVKRLRW